jgi:pimeloyl-ACP methyl ester carboxylesterase
VTVLDMNTRTTYAAAVACAFFAATASAESRFDAAGDWRGTLKNGALELRMALHLGVKSTFDALDQGKIGLPATLNQNGRHVTVTIDGVGVFEGDAAENGQSLSGQLKMGASNLPVVFQRGVSEPVNRPQNPVRPFPYREEDVAYENTFEPGVHLAGTLTLPQGNGPFPAVLLITGSGPQDRDETLFQHKPFLVLSDYLTRRGIAVLRVDDRGVGASTGASDQDTTADYATDVETGVNWLKTHKGIDPKRIGLIGHSEGGVIGPMVASRNPTVAFVVIWSGTAVRGREVLLEQSKASSIAAGVSAAAAAADTKQTEKMLDAIIAAPNSDAAYEAVSKIALAAGTPQDQLGTLKRLSGDWSRYFLSYDPAPALRSLKIPVLALAGSRDVQVVPEQNIPALKRALAGNPKAKVMELPGLNHLFQTVKTGSVAEYGTLEETIAPAALKVMGDWVVEVTRK